MRPYWDRPEDRWIWYNRNKRTRHRHYDYRLRQTWYPGHRHNLIHGRVYNRPVTDQSAPDPLNRDTGYSHPGPTDDVLT